MGIMVITVITTITMTITTTITMITTMDIMAINTQDTDLLLKSYMHNHTYKDRLLWENLLNQEEWLKDNKDLVSLCSISKSRVDRSFNNQYSNKCLYHLKIPRNNNLIHNNSDSQCHNNNNSQCPNKDSYLSIDRAKFFNIYLYTNFEISNIK